MFSVTKPHPSQLHDILEKHQDLPFSYAEVGITKDGPNAVPSGYTCGHHRIRLGSGQDVFRKAKLAMRSWEMFPKTFVDLVNAGPFEEGRVVATLFQAPGFWTLNACRIVYSVDEQSDDVDRFGFAYGTVGRHLAKGEERFLVEFDRHEESVWYEVYCFSKANHWLSCVAYPYFRLQQSRFRRLSGLSMAAAVDHAAQAA